MVAGNGGRLGVEREEIDNNGDSGWRTAVVVWRAETTIDMDKRGHSQNCMPDKMKGGNKIE